MTDVLGDVMKSGAPGHLFRYALQSDLWYKFFPPEIKKPARATKISGKRGSESDESNILDLWPAFEIESSALHYIITAQKYHQTRTWKRSVPTSAIVIAVHFL